MAIDLLTVPNILDFNSDLKLQGFKVYPIDTKQDLVRSYNRKDFYKICIITGHNVIQYADKGFDVSGHVDLYDKIELIPFEKLKSFFTKHLGTQTKTKS